MIRFKFIKIVSFVLAVNLFIEPFLDFYNFTQHTQQVKAEETFADIHALYDYWCSNDYENFPDNVGNVYCYYYPIELSTPAYNGEAITKEVIEETDLCYDTKDSIVSSISLASPISIQDFKAEEPMIEPIVISDIAADQDYVLVIGLVNDIPKEEQKILSQLQNKNRVAFTSCKYSYNELWKVQAEITQMMIEETKAEEKQLGIIGSGITCSVESDANGKFMPMENYIDVTVLEGFYEKTAAMLTERYGDKVVVMETETTIIPEDTTTTVGIDSSKEKKTYEFLHTTTALTLGDKFKFKGNWKKTNKTVWTVNPEKRVKRISENICDFKIQAKKTGYITIQANSQKGNETISERVLILDKKGTVSNQKQLLAALDSENIKKITIKTSKEKKFIIPEGNYGEKKIIINAPKSDVYVNDLTISEYLILQKVKHIYKKNSEIVSDKNSIKEISSVLKENGYVVQWESVEPQLLTGNRYRLILNNDLDRQIVLYEYEDSNKAKTEAECIDNNGTSIRIQDENGMETVTDIDWISSPHFYLFNNLIVQYIGTETKILTILQDLCGSPFVGDSIVSFLGTILELDSTGKSALIEPEEGSDILSSGDRVRVSLAINPEEKFLVGDKVKVFYDGFTMETSPLQINIQGIEKV